MDVTLRACGGQKQTPQNQMMGNTIYTSKHPSISDLSWYTYPTNSWDNWSLFTNWPCFQHDKAIVNAADNIINSPIQLITTSVFFYSTSSLTLLWSKELFVWIFYLWYLMYAIMLLLCMFYMDFMSEIRLYIILNTDSCQHLRLTGFPTPVTCTSWWLDWETIQIK